ncbi:recombinase family protein [Flammeovirga aprica]|uniref:Recombinase family protein n=1 Tax=Flammeovirga aprica JL-4 TaxID=694437 RepID=A0A7X9XDG4_9BACT|nr:recombinase family protein [Flammeovirga aprica]NME72866.1 recombinase family protein [Flammeovirga aprica JL-4]
MKLAYIRVSKADGEQSLDLQLDAMEKENILKEQIYQDYASGAKDKRPGLESCLKALREGDTLVVWKLDRLGRSLKHLVELVQDLSDRNIGLKILTGQGASMDTTTASGKFVFSIFAALAEFERELIRERTIAGLQAARARGRNGGRKFSLTKHQIYLASESMKKKDTVVSELCDELKICRQTLYRYLTPDGEFRKAALKVINAK